MASSSNIGPTVSVQGEAEFKASITNINKEFKLLGSEMKLAVSQFEKNDKSTKALAAQNKVLGKEIDSQKSKISTLTAQYDKQNKELTTLKTKLDATKAAFGADSAEVVKAQREYDKQSGKVAKLETDLNKAKTGLNNMDRALETNNKNIALQESNWTKLGKSLDGIGTKMQTVGKGMSDAGKKLSMSVTAPILAAGAAAIKTGMDFEYGMSKVKAISGATGDSFQKLNDQALQLGQDTAFSAGQAAEGMQNLASAGFSVEEIMKAMPGMLDLAASGGLDIATASDIASSALRSFGLGADQSGHFADVLAKAAADTNADVTDMGMALKYASAPAHALGLSVEEVSAAVGIMADSGIKGEQAGTTLRASLLALASPSGTASAAMKAIGLEVFDASGKMLPFKDVIGAVTESTKGLTQEAKVNALATIFGREAVSGMMVLIDKGPKKYDALTQSLVTSDGAAKAMATTMQDNAKSSIEQMMGSLETAAIKIEQAVAPTITKLAGQIQELANKFSNLSPEMQGTILKIALVAAAVGPVLVVFGALASAIGSILAVAGTISGAIAVVTTGAVAATPAIGALAGAFTLLTGPVGLAILAIAGIVAAGVLLYKHFSADAIPAVQLFGKETSAATKAAVGAYMDLDDKATKSLMSLEFSGKTVSKRTADALTKNFDDMGTQIKAGMDKHFGADLKVMQDFFGKSSALTTTEEAKALAAMTKNNADKKKSVDDGEKAIKLILDTASKEKRALTTEEQAEINKIQEKMKTNAVKSLSDTELESKSILERMKAQAGNLTAQQAAEVAKNSIEQKDKAVKAANEQYDKTVKAIIKQRDETGSITKEQADKLIKEAGRQKDDSVKKATEMNTEVVKQAKLQAKGQADQVDWTTGQVKSKWQVMVDDVKKQSAQLGGNISFWWDKIGTDTKAKWGETTGNIGYWWDKIKTDVSSTLSSIKSTISTKWKEISSTATTSWNKIKSAITSPIESAKNTVRNAINDIKGYFAHLHLPTIKIPAIKIPHIDLPHFKVSGSFSLVPPRIPSLGVSWYDQGGVFNSPSVIGVGEKRPEFVGALDDLRKIVREESGGGVKDAAIDELLAVTKQYLPQLANMQMVIDGNVMAGALTPRINANLGKNYNARGRGSTYA